MARRGANSPEKRNVEWRSRTTPNRRHMDSLFRCWSRGRSRQCHRKIPLETNERFIRDAELSLLDYSTHLSVVPAGGRLSREIALCRPGNVFVADGNDGAVTVDVLRDPTTPHLSHSGDRSKDFAPPVTFAARVHWSRAVLTQFGMGTVRMWPPLPTRSITAQCPWRIWISSNSNPTSSDLRKPQPNSMASIA